MDSVNDEGIRDWLESGNFLPFFYPQGISLCIPVPCIYLLKCSMYPVHDKERESDEAG